MNLIRITTSETIYPYSIWQLSADNPNVSFPLNPSAADLAPFGVFFVESTLPPQIDPRTERVVEASPIFHENGRWKQAWRVRSATTEEIAAWDANNPPPARWAEFTIAMTADPSVNQLFASIPPAVSSALSISLLEASKGDAGLFIGLWSSISGQMDDETKVRIAEAAERHNLPQAFITALIDSQ